MESKYQGGREGGGGGGGKGREAKWMISRRRTTALCS